MKAAVLVKNGKASEAFQVQEIEDVQAKEGQVLVKSEAFGLNFADVMARNGLYREAPPLPSVLGYDFVGRVIDVGSPELNHWMGKRVAGLSRFGAYASLIATQSDGIVEISEDLDAAKATALGTQYATAYHSAFQLTQLQAGDRVLIHAAAGGVGTALVQLALWKGCTIFATAGSDEKIASLKKAGVHHPINYRKHDYEKEVSRLLAGKRLDLTFNPIAGSTFKKDLRLLGSSGRMVLFGAAERSGKKGGKWATLRFLWSMGLLMPILLMAKSRSILGVNMLKVADHRPERIGSALRDLVELLDKGIIDPKVGEIVGIEDLARAHDDLEHRRTEGKIAVKW